MNTDGTGFYTCKECHQTESIWNHITTVHKEGEQLEDRRNVGESSCSSGDGTDQRVQSLVFMMMTMMMMSVIPRLKDNLCERIIDQIVIPLMLLTVLYLFFNNLIPTAGARLVKTLKRNLIPTTWLSYAIHLGLSPTPPGIINYRRLFLCAEV
jgi:hypothetical protein